MGSLATQVTVPIALTVVAADPARQIKGTVSGPIEGAVTINLHQASCASNDLTTSTITDANGNYAFYGLEDGLYNVVPEKEGYTFDPARQSVAISRTTQESIDFVVQQTTTSVPATTTSIQPPTSSTTSTVQSTTTTTSISTTTTTTTSCTYLLNPQKATFSSKGGKGIVRVSTQKGCSWAITNVPTWITITSGESGIGSGKVNYTVTANTSTSSRTVTLVIAGQPFTVEQAGRLKGQLM